MRRRGLLLKKQGFRLGYNFIFGKSRKQVRHGKAKKRHSELAASLVCEEGAIQGRGPFRVVRNRRIWVNKLRFCRRKRDFRVFATLNQVQGDENRAVIPNLFRNRRIEVDVPSICGAETAAGRRFLFFLGLLLIN